MYSLIAVLVEVGNISCTQYSEMYCTPYRTNTKVSTLERGQSNQFSEITELLWLMLYNSRQNNPTLHSEIMLNLKWSIQNKESLFQGFII